VTDSDRLAVLAHELRSPVAALAAIQQTLASTGPALGPDELRRLLLVAVAAGRDLDRLLSDAELFSLEPGPVEMTALVDGLRRARVTVTAEPGLVVHADAARLRQALANLVDNGLRHGDTVRVEAASHGAEIWVSVADDGPGVPDGLDPFARGVSGVGSTGLGLYVARSLAEAHGGRLELVSGVGGGACFRLALPRASDGRG
jgi:signal transduction histidine kinase